jgi:hypothetical protein
MRKAQTSMEFVILTSFMLVAFLIFYIVIEGKLVDANRSNTDDAAKQVETIVVNEISLAESVTDGYYRQFELPQNINGLNYTISIMQGAGNTPEIVTKYSGRERVYFVQQGYVNGFSSVGKGMNNITKNGGIITIAHMN